jgi:hypothetical protein
VNFEISGQIANTAKGDAPIQVRQGGMNGHILAEMPVTVLWVDISMRNAQDEGFSEDNNSELKTDPPKLGAQLLNEISFAGGGGIPSTISHVVEFRGDVFPSDFTSEIKFPRDCIDEFLATQQLPAGQPAVVIDKTNVARGDIGIGNDEIQVFGLQDLLPVPKGRIYDIDTPGHLTGNYPENPWRMYPQDTLIFIRFNFLQYAAYKGVRCSDDFAWWVRLTSQKLSPKGEGDFDFYNRQGHNDNQSGTGATSVSIN